MTACVNDAMDRIQKCVNQIKAVFLNANYDDSTMGWIVEDHINMIQEIINEHNNIEFKHSEPDPFA